MASISRKSQLTRKTHTLDLPLTLDELQTWEAERNRSGQQHAQDAFPKLSPAEREFLMTGITSEEWDLYMRDPEDDEN